MICFAAIIRLFFYSWNFFSWKWFHENFTKNRSYFFIVMMMWILSLLLKCLNFFTLFDTIYNSIRSNYNDYICSLEKKVFFEKSSIFYIELQHVYTKCPIKFHYYFNINFFNCITSTLPGYSFLKLRNINIIHKSVFNKNIKYSTRIRNPNYLYIIYEATLAKVYTVNTAHSAMTHRTRQITAELGRLPLSN